MANKFNLPQTCSLIIDGNVTLMINNGVKQALLSQGVLHPERLISHDCSVPHYYRGRGTLAAVEMPGEGNGQRMVIKHCLRGGLIRFLTKDIFWEANRPFNEMKLNTEIREKGIKTTEILAVTKHKLWGPFYRTYLISRELTHCTDLISYINQLIHKPSSERLRVKKHLFQSIARAVFKMHREGVFHSDLHLKNILVHHPDENSLQIYIIDFDKAVIKDHLTVKERAKNLLRFNRSIEKFKLRGGAITRNDQMRLFIEYFNNDSEVSVLFNNYKFYYGALSRAHRFKWVLSDYLAKNHQVN